jgi:plastocyanin
MALIGRFHPLLVHFPIALILIAALAELIFLATRSPGWHTVAVANVRAGAAFAIASAGAGWLLAASHIVEASPALEWHRWLGLTAAMVAIAAALMTGTINQPGRRQRLYRIALFSAAAIVAVAGHFGARLVWGADFLLPVEHKQPVPADGTHVVIDNFSFTPATTSVPVGTTVTWTNHDDIPHNVVSPERTFKSPVLDTDEVFSHTFTAAGTYKYYCSIHPRMTGQVVVQ